jgi:hypothetical protein
MHLKVFLNWNNPKKSTLFWAKKTQKTPKKQKTHWAGIFLNPGFFQPCLCLAAVQRLMNWSRAIMELKNTGKTLDSSAPMLLISVADPDPEPDSKLFEPRHHGAVTQERR